MQRWCGRRVGLARGLAICSILCHPCRSSALCRFLLGSKERRHDKNLIIKSLLFLKKTLPRIFAELVVAVSEGFEANSMIPFNWEAFLQDWTDNLCAPSTFPCNIMQSSTTNTVLLCDIVYLTYLTDILQMFPFCPPVPNKILLQVSAVFLSLALYGWSLIAPKAAWQHLAAESHPRSTTGVEGSKALRGRARSCWFMAVWCSTIPSFCIQGSHKSSVLRRHCHRPHITSSLI